MLRRRPGMMITMMMMMMTPRTHPSTSLAAVIILLLPIPPKARIQVQGWRAAVSQIGRIVPPVVKPRLQLQGTHIALRTLRKRGIERLEGGKDHRLRHPFGL
jgi:hypothetical protein